MKKSVLALAAASAALMMAATSCGGKKDNSTAAPAPAPEAKSEAPAAAANAPAAAVKNLKDARYISANDLTVGAVTTTFLDEASGFTLMATDEKAMAVEQPEEAVVVGDDIFSQRLSTKGSGNTTMRNITFSAKKDETILIWVAQGGSGDRPLHLVSASGDEVAVFSISPKQGSKIVADVFEAVAPADGDYCVYSTSGGCYLYQVKVGKE